MSERLIMDVVHQDRARVVKLIKALVPVDRDFLLYCVDNAVCANEIEHFRKRFTELNYDPDIEELM